MTKAEKLLRDLYVALKNYDIAENEFRRNPSDKSFEDRNRKEIKLMLAEQLAGEYLIDNEINLK
jgi:hypothetical protein